MRIFLFLILTTLFSQACYAQVEYQRPNERVNIHALFPTIPGPAPVLIRMRADQFGRPCFFQMPRSKLAHALRGFPFYEVNLYLIQISQVGPPMFPRVSQPVVNATENILRRHPVRPW